MKKYKVFITGAAGFVGKKLLLELATENYELYGGIRVNTSPLQLINNVEYLDISSINNENVKKKIIQINPHYIIHLASSKKDSSTNESNDYQIFENFSCSYGLVDAAKSCNNLKKIIYLGSCDEYGESIPPYKEANETIPISRYGKSKLEISNLFLKSHFSDDLPVIILRPSLIYGPYQKLDMFLPKLIYSLVNGLDFKMTLGQQYRDYVYIDDVLSSIKCAMKSSINLNGNIFNIASGDSIKIIDIVKLVSELIDKQSLNKIHIGSVPYRLNEIWNYSVDTSKAKLYLNWIPKVSLPEGIIKTINSFKNEKNTLSHRL